LLLHDSILCSTFTHDQSPQSYFDSQYKHKMPPSSALTRSNIRKYGGMLTVQDPLPCPLSFQIVDMKLLDPNEVIQTSFDYNLSMKRDIFYQNAKQDDDAQLSDQSQIVMLGRTEFGNSICARVPFSPFLYLYAPSIEWTVSEQRAFHGFLTRVLGLGFQDISIQRELNKRLDEWIPSPQDCKKTEELVTLKIAVPNKKVFEKLVELINPTKSVERILSGSLNRLKEELEKMQTYKFVYKPRLEKINKTLSGIEGRLKRVKQSVERATRDPDDLLNSDTESYLPSQFECPPVEDLSFECKDLTRIWSQWKEKYTLVYQYMEWSTQLGFKIKNIKQRVKPCCWETRVDFVHKFCDLHKIVPSGWVELKEYSIPNGYISHAQIECMSTVQQIKPIEKAAIAPLLMASVDGEMYTSNPRTFPNPLKADNYIITIGVVLCRTNSTDMERFVFCLKDTDEKQVTENTKMFCFNDEQELLRAWRDFMVVDTDPDFITGYNILGFDWKYFAHRAAETFKDPKIAQQFAEEETTLSDDEDEDAPKNPKPVQKKSKPKPVDDDDDQDASSSEQSKTHIIGPGDPTSKEIGQTMSRFFRLSRIWAEITPCVPKVFKSSAYGERWSHNFDMTGRAIQDLLVYVRREHKLESYKLDNVSEHFLKDNKIDLEPKLLFKYFETGARERGLIAEYCVKDCILPIKLCKHSKLMVVQNLIEMSRVTYTPLPQIINRGQQIKVFNQLVWYAHLGGFVMNDQPLRVVDGYEGATVLDPKPGWYDCPIVVLDFASLYPSIIRNKNLCYSTIVRNPKYKNLPGVEYHVIKVGDREHTFVKNTILKGVLPTLEANLLSARKAVKKQMETEENKDIYAMLDAKQLAIKVSCNSVYGFTGANMYPEPAIAESITATGRSFIDTTRDGILSGYANSDVLYGDSVTGDTTLLLRHKGKITISSMEELWKNPNNESDHDESESKQNQQHPKEYQDLDGWETWTEQGWSKIERIMRHKTSKRLFHVSTPNGAVTITEDHSLLRPNGSEISPLDLTFRDELLHSFPTEFDGDDIREPSFTESEIDHHNVLSAPRHMRLAYWNRFYNTSGCMVFYNSKNAMNFYTLARSLEYYCSVRTELISKIIYYVTWSKTPLDSRNTVTKLVELKTSNSRYVYDLTTSNHHFHAGVGSLIVHNTDSVFIKFDVTPDKEGLKKALDIGTEAAEKISKIFGEAVKLEREKAYFPFLLYGKKRYIGLKYEGVEKCKGLDTKGIEIARRDWSALVRTIYKQCIDKVFFQRDVTGAKKSVQQYCQDMIDGKLEPTWFVMSKELKSGYANPDSQVHVNVVKNIAKRTPGSEPQIGDRVPFVIIRKKTKKACEKSEDPEYARTNKIPLDYQYYLDKQLERPLTDFFTMFNEQHGLFDDVRRQLHNEYAGVGRMGLMSYFSKETKTSVDPDLAEPNSMEVIDSKPSAHSAPSVHSAPSATQPVQPPQPISQKRTSAPPPVQSKQKNKKGKHDNVKPSQTLMGFFQKKSDDTDFV
jgi:DNA polymerase elongation subunit (family B)